jgi:hypothetical protein
LLGFTRIERAYISHNLHQGIFQLLHIREKEEMGTKKPQTEQEPFLFAVP